MPHFDVPNVSHSRASNGNRFDWNTTDGPGTTTQYKFQIGTESGYYDVYDGAWKTGGVAGHYYDNVNLPGSGSHTLWVRALYVKSGRLYYTTPVSFTCNP